MNQHAVTLPILKKYFNTKLEVLEDLDAYELLQNSFYENSLGSKRFQRVSKVTLRESHQAASPIMREFSASWQFFQNHRDSKCQKHCGHFLSN